VQVEASRGQRRVTEVVAHQAQVHLVIGHVRPGTVPQPVLTEAVKKAGRRAHRGVSYP
jgi:hypothetical protein